MTVENSKMNTLHPFNRLQSQLARLIEVTPPGERLLSEPQLARSLCVSRATLREGMRTFEAQGLIRRRQGVGTFVIGKARVIESGLEQLESIERLANRTGLAVSMGELEVTEVQAGQEEADKMQVEVGTHLVRVSRVIYTDQRPVAYLVDTLSPNVISEKELSDGFNGSVLDFLQKRGTPVLDRSLTDIQSVAAKAPIAKLLEIQRGDALLMFDARLYSSADEIIDYSLSYFLPGYFLFHVVRRVGS